MNVNNNKNNVNVGFEKQIFWNYNMRIVKIVICERNI